MNNPLLSPTGPTPTQTWSSEVGMQKAERHNRFFTWLYKNTAPPVPTNPTFIQREADRKARLLSTVAFYFLATLVLFIPATLLMPISTFYLDLIIIAITVGALFANKAGKTFAAGVIIVATYEIALALGVVLICPFDPTSLQLYDLFIIGELLAVSLLPIRAIVIVALLNSAFIWLDLITHPLSPGLADALKTQFLPALVRPIGLQFIVAGVVFLFVSSAAKAIERANRAEMVATLEHIVAEQRAVSEQEKQSLEESIQQLVQAHISASNGQIAARLPYPPAKVLWPLVGVINSLWMRLQRSNQTEHELKQVKQAIATYSSMLDKASQQPYQPLPMLRTGTDLDQLVLSIRNLQSTAPTRGNMGTERRRG